MSKLSLIKREIEKLAQIPGLDGKTTVAPSKSVSAPSNNVPSLGGNKPQVPAAGSGGRNFMSGKSDVMAMQGSLLDFVRSGIIPDTGLPPGKFADGVWGPRTNASLKQVIDATQDTLLLINELRSDGINIGADVYNLKYLDALKTYVPELKNGRPNLTAKEQSEWARVIEKHLKGIKSLNEQFNVQINNKGQFRSLQDRSLDQYSSARQLTEVDAKESIKVDEHIKNNASVPVSIPGITTSIPFIALTSKDQYLKWINQVYSKTPINEKQAADLFTRVILPQLNRTEQKVS